MVRCRTPHRVPDQHPRRSTLPARRRAAPARGGRDRDQPDRGPGPCTTGARADQAHRHRPRHHANHGRGGPHARRGGPYRSRRISGGHLRDRRWWRRARRPRWLCHPTTIATRTSRRRQGDGAGDAARPRRPHDRRWPDRRRTGAGAARRPCRDGGNGPGQRPHAGSCAAGAAASQGPGIGHQGAGRRARPGQGPGRHHRPHPHPVRRGSRRTVAVRRYGPPGRARDPRPQRSVPDPQCPAHKS